MKPIGRSQLDFFYICLIKDNVLRENQLVKVIKNVEKRIVPFSVVCLFSTKIIELLLNNNFECFILPKRDDTPLQKEDIEKLKNIRLESPENGALLVSYIKFFEKSLKEYEDMKRIFLGIANSVSKNEKAQQGFKRESRTISFMITKMPHFFQKSSLIPDNWINLFLAEEGELVLFEIFNVYTDFISCMGLNMAKIIANNQKRLCQNTEEQKNLSLRFLYRLGMKKKSYNFVLNCKIFDCQIDLFSSYVIRKFSESTSDYKEITDSLLKHFDSNRDVIFKQVPKFVKTGILVYPSQYEEMLGDQPGFIYSMYENAREIFFGLLVWKEFNVLLLKDIELFRTNVKEKKLRRIIENINNETVKKIFCEYLDLSKNLIMPLYENPENTLPFDCKRQVSEEKHLCIICMDETGTDDRIGGECSNYGHVFHVKCFFSSQKIFEKCPFCKKSYDKAGKTVSKDIFG